MMRYEPSDHEWSWPAPKGDGAERWVPVRQRSTAYCAAPGTRFRVCPGAPFPQYSTLAKYNPSAGATGPQALRERAASAAARFFALHLPSPTCTSEPTIERT